MPKFDPISGSTYVAQPLNDTPCIPRKSERANITKTYKKQKNRASIAEKSARGRLQGGGNALFLGISFAPPPCVIAELITASGQALQFRKCETTVSQAKADGRANVNLWKNTEQMFGGESMFNKRELEQLESFLSALQDLARSMLDEIVEFECVVDESREKRKAETLARYHREKKRINRRKSQN